MKSDTGGIRMTVGVGDTDNDAGFTLLGTISVVTGLSLTAQGDIVLGEWAISSGTLSVTSTQGSIRDDGDDSTLIQAPSISLTAARAIGGDAPIRPGDVFLKDEVFRQAIDFDLLGGTLTLRQTGAGGNVQLRAGEGLAASDLAPAGFTPAGVGHQLALISSLDDLTIDAPLTLATAANANLLLAATDGHDVRVAATMTNPGATAEIDLVAAGGSILDLIADGVADVVAPIIGLFTQGGAVGSGSAALEIDASVRVDGDTGSGDVFLTDTQGDLPIGNLAVGDIVLRASGSILSAAPDANLTAKYLAAIAAAVGTPADPLRLSLFDSTLGIAGTLAAQVTGGVYLSNTSPGMAVGQVAGFNGVTAGGDVNIRTSGDLFVAQPISAAGSVTLTAGTAGSGAEIALDAAITGSSATVLGGAGADLFNIRAAGGVPLIVNGQGGGDDYQVAIALLSSPVIIADTGADSNTATVNGSSASAVWTVSPTQVAQAGGQAVSYSGIGTLLVNGGDDDDTFNVTPSAATTISVNGGPEEADTLNYDTTGLSGIDVLPDHIAAPGVQTVLYGNIEVVNPLFADAFNRADANTLGPGWDRHAGQFAIRSQKAVSQTAVSVATAAGIQLVDAAVSADVTVRRVRNARVGLLTGYAGPGDRHATMGGITFARGRYFAGIWRNTGRRWVPMASRLLPGFRGSGNVRFEAFGTTLAVFVNDTLAAAVNGVSSTGGVGMRATRGGTLDNFVISHRQTSPAFQDDFHRPNSRTLGANWTGRVGRLAISGDQARGTRAVNTATVAGVALQDVAVSADIALPSVNGALAGVVARYSGRGGRNMYLAGIRFSGGSYQAVLMRKLRGKWSVLGSPLDLGTANVSHNVRLTVTGTLLELFVDGALVGGVGDSALSAGGVGLLGTAGSAFANFRF